MICRNTFRLIGRMHQLLLINVDQLSYVIGKIFLIERPMHPRTQSRMNSPCSRLIPYTRPLRPPFSFCFLSAFLPALQFFWTFLVDSQTAGVAADAAPFASGLFGLNLSTRFIFPATHSDQAPFSYRQAGIK